MSIAMQGNWTVRVKSKNAAFGQRFQIIGSVSGGGTFSGQTSTPPVFVTGGQWAINIQNQPTGQPWQDSHQRIGFPTISGGLVQFDIRSNDAGGDQDFDDLILTCSMPVSAAEFVVYGKVETYAGRCIFNPCYPYYFVIDSPVALAHAVEIEGLRDVIGKLYPSAIPQVRPRIPIPDPPPDFTPLVIPTGVEATAGGLEFRSKAVASEVLLAEATAKVAKAGAAKSAKGPSADAVEEEAAARIQGTAHPVVLDSTPVSAGASVLEHSELLTVAGIADKIGILFPCESEDAPGLLLRFQEYDRTASEKLGGPYTGVGSRENLGFAVTDEVGNYIFHFSRSLLDFAAEASDLGAGELLSVQIRPDLIAQVLGTGLVLDFESAPYYNIPNLRRIDLCVPRGQVHPSVGCVGDRVINRIGDILVLHSAIDGVPNTLDAIGRITARNANAPAVDCAGWRGGLRLYACFGNPAVTMYTVTFRRIGIDANPTPVSEPHKLDYLPLLVFGGISVGPFTRPVHLGGGPLVPAPTYDNHDGDSNWIENDLKLILNSYLYRPGDQPGSVDFRIEGYNAAGNKVPGADDTIRLYIHNQTFILGRPNNSKGDIISIAMGGTTLGDCGLFDLSAPDVPLAVRYRAVDPAGFVQSWGLRVTRGNNFAMPIKVDSGVVPKAFPPPTVNPCTFHGTRDEPTASIDDYVVTALKPDGINWLATGVTFCAFAFTLTQNDRVTDGRAGGTYPQVVFWQDLVGLSYGP